MLEIEGDIWAHGDGGAIIAITTNGSLSRSGRAVLGNGVAKQATQRFPDLADMVGKRLAAEGNHVFDLGCCLVSFPVEETAWSQPDLRLIARSAQELRQLADCSGWQRIVVPRPGCGGGGLSWRDVKPLLDPWFDDRFSVITLTEPPQEKSLLPW